MLRTRAAEVSLWEAVLPEEVLRLPEELARVDALLDDPAFFAPFVPFFDPRIGRPSTPMEVYLRMMFLKFRYRLGYDSLCREVVVLVATGTHRANTPEELRAMFGDEVVEPVRIVNHDSRASETMVWRATFGRDVPVWLNREWSEADVRITTGFVEPHFFAGFSGGPKLVAPGLAALDTVLVLHDAARIGDPRATWGITHGNPLHDDVRAIGEATGVTFAVDVVLNTDQAIVQAFGGDLLAMHLAATAFARKVARQPVDGRFDVVLTTGSGYPLDQNVYQSVKGMSAAYQVVRPGGTIVCAAECRDGFPEHGSYRHELTSGSPQQLLAEMAGRERTVPDQWQVQIQARIQSTSRVVMHTSYLSDAELAAVHPGADRRHHRHRRAGAALGGPRRPAVRAARGTPVGFQKSTCVCDLQRSAAMHDRRRVSTAALPDLQRLLSWVTLLPRASSCKDIELLVLRHEVAELRRRRRA